MTLSHTGADPVADAIATHIGSPGALLPILHSVQDALGYIPRDAVSRIANALNLSRAEVHGVVTYYHYFRAEPAARHVVQICRAEACQAMGADALMIHAREKLGCTAQSHSADGVFTVEPVFCLGLCASAPALTVDERLHARVTPEAFDLLVSQLEVQS